jgi:hypothetical protein
VERRRLRHGEVGVAVQNHVLDLRRHRDRVGDRPACSCVASTARAPESAMIAPSSAPVNMVDTGTATSPARNAPRMPVSISTSSDISSSTRSSRRRPRARRAAATSPVRSSSWA